MRLGLDQIESAQHKFGELGDSFITRSTARRYLQLRSQIRADAGRARFRARQDGYVTRASTQHGPDWPQGGNSACLSGWKESPECQVRRRANSLMRLGRRMWIRSSAGWSLGWSLHFCFTGCQVCAPQKLAPLCLVRPAPTRTGHLYLADQPSNLTSRTRSDLACCARSAPQSGP